MKQELTLLTKSKTPKLVKITEASGIPLIGCLPFGVIDRGSNLLQVRTATFCNMRCPFCSTSANDSKRHPVNYQVNINYLLRWVKEVVEFKDCDVEINIDSVGEPSAYPKLVELVKGVRALEKVKVVSMQSNGTLFNEKIIKDLENAGLTRINLSLHTLDKEKGKLLFGMPTYNLDKVLENVMLINESKIELCLTPVLIPGVNEDDVKGVIKFSKELKCRIGIQKYEVHKTGRKMKNVKEMTYWKFYKKLEEWEKEFDVKLKIGPNDYKIFRRKAIPKEFNKDEIVNVEVKKEGWQKDQMIGVAKNRVITLINCSKPIGSRVKAKIVSDKNNIYIAKSL